MTPERNPLTKYRVEAKPQIPASRMTGIATI